MRYLDRPTTFFLFSDGYQDQFGGSQGCKFLATRFRTLLGELSGLPCAEQKERLGITLGEWIGEGGQIDDILVIGAKVG